MKNKLLKGLLVTCCAFAAQPLSAQTTCPTEDTYTVQQGDNLWQLSRDLRDNAELWPDVLYQNPFLSDRVREEGGRAYVLIRPGERLCGLYELGLVPSFNVSNIDSLTSAPSDNPLRDVPWEVWVIIAAAIIASIVFLEREDRRWRLNQDPETSGPPIVEGGVNDPESARTRFEQMGAQRFSQRLNIIGDPVAGFGYGIMNVSYGDGRDEPRRLDGNRVWRALIRLEDGTEEHIYLLQACGNDLTYGGVRRNEPDDDFRFVPDVEAATEAPLAEAAPPPAREEEAAPEPEAAPEAESGTQVEYKPGTRSQPALLRISGADVSKGFTFNIGPNGASLRMETSRSRSN